MVCLISLNSNTSLLEYSIERDFRHCPTRNDCKENLWLAHIFGTKLEWWWWWLCLSFIGHEETMCILVSVLCLFICGSECSKY